MEFEWAGTLSQGVVVWMGFQEAIFHLWPMQSFGAKMRVSLRTMFLVDGKTSTPIVVMVVVAATPKELAKSGWAVMVNRCS